VQALRVVVVDVEPVDDLPVDVRDALDELREARTMHSK
jgi:hypothetical protein